jgi:hypothetical protein
MWSPSHTPVAFWAWRNQTPAEDDVRLAVQKANAAAIFLRAGQIDFQNGQLRRIRPVTGSLPRTINLHLVYNATRTLLSQLEQVDEGDLATAVANAYQADTERAAKERARVVGLQIDIDVPTRLLDRYEKTLKALRARLKPGTQLSITGLPTWMQSAELKTMLAQVDFWVPQLYGAEVPQRSSQSIAISSPQSISRFVDQARALNKPFYAGLSAYSWTMLYGPTGSLIALRGDMDPGKIAADENLELIEERPFAVPGWAENSSGITSEWRYVYRARADGVTDELAMHAGDVLVVDVPTAESLRLSSRVVRQRGGEKLLGICVFRLPSFDDPANLNIAQVASAIADRDSVADVHVRLLPASQTTSTETNEWILEVKNTGTAGAVLGRTTIDLETSPGTLESLQPQESATLESMCVAANSPNLIPPQPCSPGRANLLRFRPLTLASGQTVAVKLSMNPAPGAVIPVSVEMQTDNGKPHIVRLEVIPESESTR